MSDIFSAVLYQPLYNLLVFFYDLLPWGGLGLAIIIVTAIVKTAIFPLTFKTMKAQKQLQEVQPKIEAIKKQYKDDKETMAKELMAVYKSNNVNPFASCLPTIVQLVIFLTLFQVLKAGIGTIKPDLLYSFVNNPGTMEPMFLGMNLAEISIPLAILSAVMQFFQARQMITRRPPKAAQGSSGALDEDVTANMNRVMMYGLPLIMLIAGVTTLPGGVTLYIFVSTALTYVLTAYFLKPKKEEKVEIVSTP